MADPAVVNIRAVLHILKLLEKFCPMRQVLKRTMQTALVWTLYEELQPRLTAAVEKLQRVSS